MFVLFSLVINPDARLYQKLWLHPDKWLPWFLFSLRCFLSFWLFSLFAFLCYGAFYIRIILLVLLFYFLVFFCNHVRTILSNILEAYDSRLIGLWFSSHFLFSFGLGNVIIIAFFQIWGKYAILRQPFMMFCNLTFIFCVVFLIALSGIPSCPAAFLFWNYFL